MQRRTWYAVLGVCLAALLAATFAPAAQAATVRAPAYLEVHMAGAACTKRDYVAEDAPTADWFDWSCTSPTANRWWQFPHCGDTYLGSGSGTTSSVAAWNTRTSSGLNWDTVCPTVNDRKVILRHGPSGGPYVDVVTLWANPVGPTPAGPPDGSAGNCTLSDARIAEVARAAGFTDAEGPTAVAIALAESAGKVNAVGGPNSDGSYDLGLWQINGKAHPTYNNSLSLTSPYANAQAARAIFLAAPANSSFTPWVTFNEGLHKRFMSRAAEAWKNTTAPIAYTSCTDAGLPSDGTQGDAVACEGFNPVTYIKCLFIPKPESVTQFNQLQTMADDRVPFSYVAQTTELFTAMADHCDYINGCGESIDLAIDVPFSADPLVLFSATQPLGIWLKDQRPWVQALLYLTTFMPIVLMIWRQAFPVVGESK